MTDIVVTDNLAAEIEIDRVSSVSQGTLEIRYTGRSEKAHLTWNVGTLQPDEWAWFTLEISTDLNPAGRQEYTSPGVYELNSGPTMKYYVDGIKYSLEIAPIIHTVVPAD